MGDAYSGRIETAKILAHLRGHRAEAEFSDERINWIYYGEQFRGRYCLVRYTRDDKLYPKFIKVTDSDHILSLAPEEYILIAPWLPSMHKERQYPTIEEINCFYDPGNLAWVIYLRNKHSQGQGRVSIGHHSCKSEWYSIAGLINLKLPDPTRSSRLVICEAPSDIEKCMTAAENEGLVPIVMQSWRPGYS